MTTTMHRVYAVSASGHPARRHFAAMPTQVALRYRAARPEQPMLFVPALPTAAGCLACGHAHNPEVSGDCADAVGAGCLPGCPACAVQA